MIFPAGSLTLDSPQGWAIGSPVQWIVLFPLHLKGRDHPHGRGRRGAGDRGGRRVGLYAGEHLCTPMTCANVEGGRLRGCLDGHARLLGRLRPVAFACCSELYGGDVECLPVNG